MTRLTIAAMILLLAGCAVTPKLRDSYISNDEYPAFRLVIKENNIFSFYPLGWVGDDERFAGTYQVLSEANGQYLIKGTTSKGKIDVYLRVPVQGNRGIEISVDNRKFTEDGCEFSEWFFAIEEERR